PAGRVAGPGPGRGELDLGPPRFVPGVVELGATTLVVRDQTGERLLELLALEPQHFQVFRRHQPVHTLDARAERLGVLGAAWLHRENSRRRIQGPGSDTSSIKRITPSVSPFPPESRVQRTGQRTPRRR